MKGARRIRAALGRGDWIGLPATRSQAQEKETTFYFTGAACAGGHVARRFTVSGCCEQCLKTAAQAHLVTFDRAAKLTIETGLLHYVSKAGRVMATAMRVFATPDEVERWFMAAGDRSRDGVTMVPVFDRKGRGRLAECLR